LRSASSKTLCLLVSAAAFGALAWSAEQGPTLRRGAAPPIRALNRPARPALEGVSIEEFVTLKSQKLGVSTPELRCLRHAHCAEVALKTLLKRVRKRDELLRPVHVWRTIADLPWPHGRLALRAWRTRTGSICFDTVVPGSGNTDPFGPCRAVADRALGAYAGTDLDRCARICLQSNGFAAVPTPDFWLSGVVSARATSLRVTRVGERIPTEYPLTGPLVPGAPARRVFLLDLGRRDWQLLQLRRGTTVLERKAQPSFVLTLERCQQQRTVRAIRSCLRAGPG